MAHVIFREEDHTYWAGALRLPSVTEILKPLMGDLRFVRADLLQHKSELGQAVHKAIELHLLDDLEYSSLSPVVAQYFDQFLKFEKETGFQSFSTEEIISHPAGYAGRFDAAGRTRTKSGIFDWKTTSALSPVVALQMAAYLAAYEQIADRKKFPFLNRFALRLTNDSYRLVEYSNSDFSGDFKTFVSLLNLHQWCAINRKNLEVPQ